jgi:serine/threonine-protein kinase
VPGYTELKVLGSGGFGEVVLARHDASGTQVAIKYLLPSLLADPEFTRLFRAEAAVLASLTDPNVVRLYEYVEGPQGAAIVMELVDGVCLREILSHQGKTTAEAALVVLQGSLLGLAAAHARGVVHRDYKPENVLVRGDGLSKLTDFGIAARAGDRPFPAGTLAYAPPEQLAGGPATPASDVYAATATFYECLAGHPPFTGKTTEVLLRQHQSAPVPLEPVPAALRPLVAAGMAKDPAERPADATTFVTRLRAAASESCGPDWEDGGRSHLGEAALLLAAWWPSALLAALWPSGRATRGPGSSGPEPGGPEPGGTRSRGGTRRAAPARPEAAVPRQRGSPALRTAQHRHGQGRDHGRGRDRGGGWHGAGGYPRHRSQPSRGRGPAYVLAILVPAPIGLVFVLAGGDLSRDIRARHDAARGAAGRRGDGQVHHGRRPGGPRFHRVLRQ